MSELKLPAPLQIHLEFRSFLNLKYGETRIRGRRWFDQSLDNQHSIVLQINTREVYKENCFSTLIGTTRFHLDFVVKRPV